MSKIRKVEGVRYSLEIPELKKTISYRAMKVGENKALLTALELKDESALVNTLVDIVGKCTFGTVEVDKIPMHILDLIFLKVYIKSIGHMANAVFTCGGFMPDESKCGNTMNVQINLDLAQLVYPEGYEATKVLDLGDGMHVKLRLPSFEKFKKLNFDSDLVTINEQYIFAGIESIIDGDNVMVPGIDFSEADVTEWINSLESQQLEQINLFFSEIPVVKQSVAVTCPKCGKKEEFELNKLEDFFA